MKIGITGATGVLGRSVREHWPSVSWHPFTGDIRDLAAVRQWADVEVDAVLHLAAIVPVTAVEADPGAAFDVNVRGTWNVMLSLRARDVWTFLASSSHVYSSSLYGVTKMLAEKTAEALGPVCVGRIFSFSAPSQREPYLLPSLVRRISAAEPNAELVVRGGHNVRDFLTTRAIVSAIRTLYEHRATGVYDIGSGDGITVLDVARRLATRLGRTDLSIITHDEQSDSLVADASRLRSLGWNASSIDELLAELVP